MVDFIKRFNVVKVYGGNFYSIVEALKDMVNVVNQLGEAAPVSLSRADSCCLLGGTPYGF